MQDLLGEAQQAFDDGTLHKYVAAKFILASTTTKLGIAAIAAGFVFFFLTGIDRTTAPGPEQAAKQFMQALAEQNRAEMVNLTCDAQQQHLNNGLAVPWAIMSLGQSFFGLQLNIDVSHLTYTVVSNDGTYAIVHIRGPMASSGFGLFGATSNVDMNEPMLHEHDRWVVCG
jgi:hypothetical protein